MNDKRIIIWLEHCKGGTIAKDDRIGRIYWSVIVKRRIAIKGHRCEDCGATNVKLIGHHVLPFSALKDVRALRASRGQDGIDLIEFCRLRCPTCETQAHKNPAYVWGNPPEEQERVIAYLEESGYQIRQWRYRRQFDRTALAPAGEMME